MIQGGDPTGTGRGGESVFGKTFEVDKKLATRSGCHMCSPAASRLLQQTKVVIDARGHIGTQKPAGEVCGKH